MVQNGYEFRGLAPALHNRPPSSPSGLLALFSVFICSTALYYTEHWNPDPEIVAACSHFDMLDPLVVWERGDGGT